MRLKKMEEVNIQNLKDFKMEADRLRIPCPCLRKIVPDKIFYLDVHDFSPFLPGLDDILRLKGAYPNFKITCFTIPLPNKDYCDKIVVPSEYFSLEIYKEWAEKINSYDWMQVGIHGYTHAKNEMRCTYQETINILEEAERLFDEAGLNYKKIFAAPYWRYSREALLAIRDKGYMAAVRNGNMTKDLHVYNWGFNEKSLPLIHKVFGHGHLNSCGVKDSIGQCFDNILNNIPKNAQFEFISELYESKAKTTIVSKSS